MILTIETLTVIAGLIAMVIVLFIYVITRPKKMNLGDRMRSNSSFVRTYTCSESKFGRFYRKRLNKLMPERSLSGFGKFMGVNFDILNEKILVAGKKDETSVMEILALKVLGIGVLVIGAAAFVFSKNLFVAVIAFYGFAMLFLVPEADIDNEIKKKREDVEAHLMRYVENTRLCMVAGADLEESLRMIAENTEGELGRIVQQAFISATYTGSWEEELTAAADTLKVEEFQNFVSDLVTARKTGTDIESALLSEVERLDAVNEARIMGSVKALPSKLGALQVLFCMIPMFGIVMLPAVIQLLEAL